MSRLIYDVQNLRFQLTTSDFVDRIVILTFRGGFISSKLRKIKTIADISELTAFHLELPCMHIAQIN